MPRQETEGRILAADKDEEEKELGKVKTHMLNKYSTVFSDTINEKRIAGTPMKIHLRDDIQINPQKCYVARATSRRQQRSSSKSLRQRGSSKRLTSRPPGQAQDSLSPSQTGGSGW
jgi:hypothetical protein